MYTMMIMMIMSSWRSVWGSLIWSTFIDCVGRYILIMIFTHCSFFKVLILFSYWFFIFLRSSRFFVVKNTFSYKKRLHEKNTRLVNSESEKNRMVASSVILFERHLHLFSTSRLLQFLMFRSLLVKTFTFLTSNNWKG